MDEFRNRDILDYFRSGKYKGKFVDFTEEGLPLTDRKGRPVSHADKAAYIQEKSKTAKLWELEEQKVSRDLDLVAKLYNQTSTKKNVVKGALSAYGGKLGRTSVHEKLKLGEETKTGNVPKKGYERGPQEMRVLLSAAKAGMDMMNDADGHLYVSRVLVGSTAHDMGIQVNDRVLAVNGVVSVQEFSTIST